MISKIRSKKIAISLVAFVALACGPLTLFPVHAQVAGAALSGRVTDPSGEVIPKTQISIKNVATAVTRTVTTDAAGFYTAPNLLPGTYEIRATAPGFSTAVRTGITLTVGAEQALDITMQVGTVEQTVHVSGEAPVVQLTSSTVSAEVNATTVRELPLNGRSWADLATLQPGVVAIQTQVSIFTGSPRGTRGFGDQITVSGARPQQNNYRLDGVSINDYSNGAPGSVLGGNLGVEAIQEFSVLTSNYSAEYGRTSGGVVNAMTRSGTNEFHGGMYEFLRNSALDARNFFDAAKIPPFRRNQFGADAGGPIHKDKVFIFGDYEGIRQSKGITNVDTVPSAAARSGTLCSAPDSTPACTPTPIPGGVNASAQKYLPFWPLPNSGIVPGTNGDVGILTAPGQQVVTENFFTVRVDNKISEKDSLAGTYLRDYALYNSPDPLNAIILTSRTHRQIATLEETHIFGPTLVNAVRFGYSHESVISGSGTTAINPVAKDPSLGAIPGQDGVEVLVGVLTPIESLTSVGRHDTGWDSFQGYDDASWTHGTHSLKFGGGVERMDLNPFYASNPSGSFTFSTLSSFLTNSPKRFKLGFPNTITQRGLRQTIFGLYIQDDWRVRSNLTLNLGLRYEMATVPTEVKRKLSTLINVTDPTPHLGSPFFSNPTLRNFAPRVGFAWDPFHNGKTAVRGGFGVFDVLPLMYQFLLGQATSFPFFQQGQVNKLPPGSFYSGGVPLAGLASVRQAFVEQHPHRDYVMQWNLNLQRELAPNLTGLLGYVGSRGVHQANRTDDIDIVIPTPTPFGYLFPSPVGSGRKLNLNFGNIPATFWDGNSFYDALEVGVQKTMSHGVQIQGSFTWGKSIDTGSAPVAGDQYSNSISSLPYYNLKLARGPSEFNIGRILVINGTWQVPSPKSLTGPTGWVTSGWELGVIFRVSDGVPFTATWGTNGDPQGLNSNDPWAFPDRLNGPGCGSLTNPGNPKNYIKTQCFAIPTAPSQAFYNANCDPAMGNPALLQCFNLRGNAGRNILTGPGMLNLDFSVFKNNHVRRISETFNVQFRAEVFNILNRANFATPLTPGSTDIFDSTGAANGIAGLLTSTTTTSREIQFALKFIW